MMSDHGANPIFLSFLFEQLNLFLFKYPCSSPPPPHPQIGRNMCITPIVKLGETWEEMRECVIIVQNV